MHAEPLFTYATLFGFLYTLARISCVFAFLPLAAFKSAPETPKIVLALAFTLILFPQWKVPASQTFGLGRLVMGISAEAALGLAIGLSLAIVLEVFQVAAQVVSLQAGFGFASTIDPSSGADSTVLLTLAQITAGLLFFATGADRLLVRALADSLRLCPPESFTVNRGWADMVIRFSGTIFGAGLRLAAPVVALLLLADASLAVLGRVQTQIHLVSLTMPVKLGVAMLMMAATLVFQPRVFQTLMTAGIRLIEGILRSGH
ncbi:MAG TPA: flagellar biosynthetic protein FliR [Bryobacteraceae bacterium]|nr:flagellar biosynthetic protein FliR [Bryobacteraceae bacterium]